MNFEFASCARAWKPAIVLSCIVKTSIMDDQNSLSAIRNMLISTTIRQFLITLEPSNFCIRLRNFTNQFDSVCFIYFDVGKIFGKDSFFL